MRPKSAGCGSLSECITHLRAKSHLTGRPLVAAESVWRYAFREDSDGWVEDFCGKQCVKYEFVCCFTDLKFALWN